MTETVKAPRKAASNRIQRHHLSWLLLLSLAAVLLGSGYWWFFKHNRVTTDDAYVKAESAQISSRIPGTIVKVGVDNDDPVKVGQLLLQLDPSDYQVAVERSAAALAEAEAEASAAEVSVSQTDAQTAAQVSAAEAALHAARDNERESRHKIEELQSRRLAVLADLSQAQKDNDRFENLFKQGAGTERIRDQARTALKKAQAQTGAIDSQVSAIKASLASIIQAVDRAKAQLESAQSERFKVEMARYRVASLKAKRDRAKAELDAARLSLSYCAITAPIGGYVAQKNIQVGDRVQPGQALMAVIPLQEVYVEANFKETQLTDVRLGQPATIHADVYPGYSYHGKVVGIRAGTGAAFSLLPPENATGNWIKVVQRVPVKIYLDKPPPADHPLGVGFSLEVSIDTSNRSGGVLIAEDSLPLRASAPSKP